MTFAPESNPRIQDTPPFRIPLSDNDKAFLGGLGATLRRYAPHETIMRQGDDEGRAFIVHSGWSCVHTDLPDGERQIIDFPFSGDIIGLRAYQSPSYVSFTSITKLIVFEVPAKSLTAAVEHSPRLAGTFLSIAARQRAILVEHLTNVGRRRGAARAAHLLLEIGTRLGDGQRAPAQYECPLTQYDLADALGMTAIHINRILKDLRELDLLSFRHRTVDFINLPATKKFAGFNPSYLLLERI